jgi:hypothetical protein
MGLRVGDEVWRRGAFGWSPGRITEQVGDHDAWYVTEGPGQTYVSQGRDLRPVGGDLQD